MHEFLISVVAFIVLVGVMVLVHEFGHFIVAKLCGVRVERFSIGFPPRLFGVKIGETDYCISATLLGGYVKMTGENFSELSDAAKGTANVAPPDDPGALTSHPRWQRMLIGAAGPVANFILAFVLMFVYYGWINEVPAVEVKETTIEWVTPGSPAAQAGLQPGDIIRHFADADNPDWDNIVQRLVMSPNQTLPVAVERGGSVLQLALRVPGELKTDDLAGILPQFTPGPIGVKEVQPGTPADQAGLRAGDAIQSVDDHPFHSVTTLLAYMQDGQGKPISLVIVRNGAVLPPIVAHPAKLDDGWKLGFKPVPPLTRNDPLPLNMAINKSSQYCVDNSTLLLQVLKRVVIHKIAASSALAGPLGIARAAGDVAETKGWIYKFNLAAQISISLGILNLMPFPILDGGMILILLIEGALRRDISINIKERIYQGAFVLLVSLFVFITFNDIAKLPFFTHLKP